MAMELLFGIIFVLVVYFAIENVNKRTIKIQRLLVTIALVMEGVAIIIGGVAGDTKAHSSSCYFAPITQYIAWALGAAGIISACTNAYFAIRGRMPSQIIAALLFLLPCLVAAAFAWFLSVFCFTF